MAQNDLNKNAGLDDPADAIPVSGIKPIWIALGAGVVVVGLVATVFVKMSNRGHIPKGDDMADQAAMDEAQRNSEAAKEQKEHLQVTQAALARLADEHKAAAAASAAAEAAKKDEEAKTAAAAPPAGGGAAAPAAPKPKTNAKAMKKLDGLGDDIASQLK